LRIGNAVRILHREGVRGYVEIIGEGRAIPTPVSGSSLPPEAELPDMILSGLEMSATTPNTLGVNVSSGTYRINGVIYYFTPGETDYITMNDPPPMAMTPIGAEIMGTGIATVELDAVPSTGYYRYDLLVVGTDSQLDYIAGTPSATNPVKPTIPSDHLQVGEYIFVSWSTTAISNANIGYEFTSPYASTMEMTISSDHFQDSETPYYFDWVSGETYASADIGIELLDQYGMPISVSSFDVTLEIMNEGATGQVYSEEDGWGSPSVTSSTGSFQYRRVQDEGEVSPQLQASLTQVGRGVLVASDFIILMSEAGSGELLVAHGHPHSW
jgi:hypothetical protein